MLRKILKRRGLKIGVGSESASVGKVGEDIAVKYLKKNGYKILERNWYNTRGKRIGEIDVIAKRGDTHIFVEVKSRKVRQGSVAIPEEQISASKLAKLSRIIECYIAQEELWSLDWQLDAVTVVFSPDMEHEIRHIKNIFL